MTLSLLTFTSQSFLSAEDTSMLLSRRNDSMLIKSHSRVRAIGVRYRKNMVRCGLRWSWYTALGYTGNWEAGTGLGKDDEQSPFVSRWCRS